jgi:iron complex transport system permease protein
VSTSTTTADAGHGRGGRALSPLGSARVLRPAAGVSWRWHPRAAVVCTAAAALLAGLVLLAVVVGDFPVPVGEALTVLVGGGEGPSTFIVRELRLPRALAAIGVGAALGMSGALFQTLVRNPLGSPDLIGFTGGASAGAVAGIVLAGVTGIALVGSAMAGGLLTAVVVYVLAYRRGVLGTRLVLVGIAVGAMLNAVTWWLLSRAELTEAQVAAVWLVGSLTARGWDHVLVLAVVLVALAPLAVVAARWLRIMELGDDAARALGLPVGRAQVLVAGLGVALAAIGVAIAGPVPFVALAAPQLARRLVRGAGVGLVSSALVGAVLLLAGDIAAQRALAPAAVPVGVATGILGGVYLAWLLISEGRRTS